MIPTDAERSAYKRPTEYWCNDDEQVRIIERALDMYEASLSESVEDSARLDWMERNLTIIRDIGWLSGMSLRKAVDDSRNGNKESNDD